MFSESSSLTTDPLVDLGTHNAGTDDTVDIFIRNNGTQVNHAHSPTPGLDDNWHHLAWTYERGTGKLFIDAKQDYTTTFTQGATAMDTTSIGAIVRASSETPIQYFFTGLIDDVAVWERALSEAEIQDLVANGIQTPVPVFAPVFVVQPKGATNLVIGDTLTLSAQVTGTRPFTYEWRRNNTPITGASAKFLTLSNLTQANAGEYILVVRNSANAATSQVATVSLSLPAAPNLTNAIVAYWPLNEVQGTKTPDLVNGYDMELENMTSADLVGGNGVKHCASITPGKPCSGASIVPVKIYRSTSTLTSPFPFGSMAHPTKATIAFFRKARPRPPSHSSILGLTTAAPMARSIVISEPTPVRPAAIIVIPPARPLTIPGTISPSCNARLEVFRKPSSTLMESSTT